MRKTYDFSNSRRGAVLNSAGKARITIMLDNAVLEHFRKQGEELGVGYQTLINRSLRETMINPTTGRKNRVTLSLADLRRIIREELKAG